MTYERPVVESFASGESVIAIGGLGRVSVTGGDVAEIQTYPITDERLGISWKHEVYRVLIKMDDSGKTDIKIS
jgi:hypothetical protein